MASFFKVTLNFASRVFRRWPLSMSAAGCLSIVSLLFYLKNEYGVYAADKLIAVPLLAIAIFGITALALNWLVYPAWTRITHHQKTDILLMTLTLLAVILFLWPPPEPNFPQPHRLVISTSGEYRSPSTGALVEITKLRSLSGRAIPNALIERTADWQVTENGYYSYGAPDSRLVINGPLPVGLVVNLRYLPTGGIVTLDWDGTVNSVDLFKRESLVAPLILKGRGILGYPPGQAVLFGLIDAGYCLGLFFLLAAGLIIIHQVTGDRTGIILYWAAMLGITGFFIFYKISFLQVDAPHAMLDSYLYVATGQQPLFSTEFWAGVRPFTMPLFIKALGIHTFDYLNSGQLARWAGFQTIFSATAWLLLALALAQSVHRRWVSLGLFGITLTFGLSAQIGLWDALLLSESISFSLMALMTACWIAILVFLPRLSQPLLRWGIIIISILITILYSACRDSNLYFILGAAVLVIGGLTAPHLAQFKRYLWVYAGFSIILATWQLMALNAPARHVVMRMVIYDQLAMRILPDPSATAFFVQQGLPVTENLKLISTMDGMQYVPYLNNTPEFEPFRAWIDCCSKSAYIKYLFANPLKVITEPIINWQPLFSGNLMAYRNPLYGLTPLPDRINAISKFFFGPEGWMMVLLLLVLPLIGLAFDWSERKQPLWILTAALSLPLIPMAYLIWFAEPMEVDRHAAQIALQLRLAGWISVVLALEMLQDRIHARIYRTTRRTGLRVN